jgi:hypothetical protein
VPISLPTAGTALPSGDPNGSTVTSAIATADAAYGQVLTGNGTTTTSGSYFDGDKNGTGAGFGQNWFQDLSATITDSNIAGNPNFAFELVNAATGAGDISMKGGTLNNTSGNWRFDNVFVAVPEPSTWMTLFGGIGVLVSSRCFRRRSVR